MSKIRKAFRLEPETVSYLESFAKKYHGGNATLAIENIILAHAQQDTVRANAEFAQLVADTIYEKLDSTLVRIRLGSNGADRNSQIMLELFNTLMAHFNIPALLSTDNLTTPTVEQAREVVKTRIENFRNKKLEREQKKEE